MILLPHPSHPTFEKLIAPFVLISQVISSIDEICEKSDSSFDLHSEHYEHYDSEHYDSDHFEHYDLQTIQKTTRDTLDSFLQNKIKQNDMNYI